MNTIRFGLILFLLAATCGTITSCIKQFGISVPSVRTRKEKKKLAPPPQFSSELFEYRKKYGFWPKSEYDFRSFNSAVVSSIYEMDFESWTLGPFSNDTIRIYWVHQPLEEETASVGIVPIPGKKLYLISEHIFSTRSVNRKLVKKKNFN